MSTPMTVAQWKAQAAKWGVPLNVVGNPATHNRNSRGRWGDVKGFVWHHFGSNTPDRTDLPQIVNGRSDLPGPLSQLFLGDDSVVDLVSTGRCNHAGLGSIFTFRHVVNEDYSGVLKPGVDSVDFNAYFYGMEIGYDGTALMGDQRYRNALLISAAICDFHGWTEKSVIAHFELTSRKWDPGYRGHRYDMGKVRNDIRILLAQGAQAVSTAKVPVDTVATAMAARNGGRPRIAIAYLRRGMPATWSVATYKRAALAKHGPMYRAFMRRAYGSACTSPSWMDGSDAAKRAPFAEAVTSDLYRSLDVAYPGQGWGTGDLTVPGPRLLAWLGFEVV